MMIFVVTIPEQKKRIVLNLNQMHQKIIAYFGKRALEIYGLPPDYEHEKINYANYKNLLPTLAMSFE